jgi:hypothetical protein
MSFSVAQQNSMKNMNHHEPLGLAQAAQAAQAARPLAP